VTVSLKAETYGGWFCITNIVSFGWNLTGSCKIYVLILNAFLSRSVHYEGRIQVVKKCILLVFVVFLIFLVRVW
jgi:hypothetical protein